MEENVKIFHTYIYPFSTLYFLKKDENKNESITRKNVNKNWNTIRTHKFLLLLQNTKLRKKVSSKININSTFPFLIKHFQTENIGLPDAFLFVFMIIWKGVIAQLVFYITAQSCCSSPLHFVASCVHTAIIWMSHQPIPLLFAFTASNGCHTFSSQCCECPKTLLK